MSSTSTPTEKPQASDSGSPMPGEPEFLAVGKLRRPHGVRGEIRMSVWTDFPERLQSGKQVFIGEDFTPIIIKTLRPHGKDVLVSFDAVDSREEAGKFRNLDVFVRTADLPALPDDDLYLHQLLGMTVIQEENHRVLGFVAEILETGANHVFLVRRDGKPDLLIPDIDPVVQEINLEKQQIFVHLLPGLIPDEKKSS